MTTPPVFGRRKPAAPDPAPPPAAAPRTPTSKISALLKIPHEQRDRPWQDDFANLVFDTCYYELDPKQKGPDGHYYRTVCLTEPDSKNAMKFTNMAKKTMNSGLGIAIFTPGNRTPDFVFRLGQLIGVAMHQKLMPLYARPVPLEDGFVMDGEAAFFGQVSPNVFPDPARKAAREYLEERHGIRGVSVQQRIEGQYMDTKSVLFCIPQKLPLDREDLAAELYWYLSPEVEPRVVQEQTEGDFYPL